MGKVERIDTQSFPLRIEKHSPSGWYFVSVDGIHGLSLFGPELDPLLQDVELVAFDILRDRGVKIELAKVETVMEYPVKSGWGRAEYHLRAA